MLTVIAIPALKDNYIWLLINPANQHCAVVDPGVAEPVLSVLKKNNFILDAILLTHHHHDHTGGVPGIREQLAVQTYGPRLDGIPSLDHALGQGERVSLPNLDLQLTVLDIPGHTKGHIAYVGHGMLFCGDTLFSAGCGRLFEGTAAEMYASLSKLANLPETTRVYSAHEYTEANLRFAQTVEPHNAEIAAYRKEVASMRAQGKPSLPSTLHKEKSINPFLRCDQDSVIESVRQKINKPVKDPVSIFQALRAWKDTF